MKFIIRGKNIDVTEAIKSSMAHRPEFIVEEMSRNNKITYILTFIFCKFIQIF